MPFIARYRKEVTDNLDDTQLRDLEERLLYLRDMEDRRATILASIEEQGKMTDPRCAPPSRPPTPSRRWKTCTCPTSRRAARAPRSPANAAWSPLAQALLADPTLDPQPEAAKFVNGNPTADGAPDVKAALDGARDILSEQFGETAELLAKPARAPVGSTAWSPPR